MGRRLIETWEEHLRPKNLENLTKIFVDMVSTSGWGRFSAENVSEETITIKLENNIGSNEGADIGYFISGLLSGFGEFALYSAHVSEIDSSDNTMVFQIKKRNIDF